MNGGWWDERGTVGGDTGTGTLSGDSYNPAWHYDPQIGGWMSDPRPNTWGEPGYSGLPLDDHPPVVTMTRPRPSAVPPLMQGLQYGYEQAFANPYRAASPLPTALSSDPYFDEYDAVLGPNRRPINGPVPGVQGLFGAPSPAQVMIQNYTPPGRKPLVAEARNARPREYVPAPAPAPQPYVEYAPSEPLRQMVQQFIAAPAARNTATARNTR